MQNGADNALVAVCRLLPAFTHVLANAPKYLYMHSTFAVMNQWLTSVVEWQKPWMRSIFYIRRRILLIVGILIFSPFHKINIASPCWSRCGIGMHKIFVKNETLVQCTHCNNVGFAIYTHLLNVCNRKWIQKQNKGIDASTYQVSSF